MSSSVRSSLLYKLLGIFLLTFLTQVGFAQQERRGDTIRSTPAELEPEEDEIVTDRDSFTPSAQTANKGRTIFEASYSFIDNRESYETHSFPEILWRYGLNEKWELRLGWNYEIGAENSIVSGNGTIAEFGPESEIERSSRLLFGVKRSVTRQEGIIPHSAIIVQGSTPTSGENTFTSLAIVPVTGWRFRNGWTWDSALRFSTSGGDGDTFNLWDPSTVLKFPLGERFQGHVEYFGIRTQGRQEETTQHFVSPGIHLLLSKNFEIGWRSGWGLNDSSPNFFFNFGLGKRF
jgi:hypothetical protein